MSTAFHEEIEEAKRLYVAMCAKQGFSSDTEFEAAWRRNPTGINARIMSLRMSIINSMV